MSQKTGVRRFVTEKFVVIVLDYSFAVGVLGFMDFALGASFGDE